MGAVPPLDELRGIGVFIIALGKADEKLCHGLVEVGKAKRKSVGTMFKIARFEVGQWHLNLKQPIEAEQKRRKCGEIGWAFDAPFSGKTLKQSREHLG